MTALVTHAAAKCITRIVDQVCTPADVLADIMTALVTHAAAKCITRIVDHMCTPADVLADIMTALVTHAAAHSTEFDGSPFVQVSPSMHACTRAQAAMHL